ncbi:MAG: hypothetical protein IPM23_17855 [Candidatus Melainabacteria bacterium]|nr:hypothetical protein [Candidatus Melainabacteria bacterium]
MASNSRSGSRLQSPSQSAGFPAAGLFIGGKLIGGKLFAGLVIVAVLASGIAFASTPTDAAGAVSVGEASSNAGKPSLIDRLEPMPLEPGQEPGKEPGKEPGQADDNADGTTGDTARKSRGSAREKDKPITVFEDQDEEDEDLAPTGEVDVYLSVAVPHTRNVVVKGMAYPYPPKMPPISSNMIPDDDKSIKELLMGSGYLRRQTANQPNPLGGWRWQYAFNKAVKKSRLAFPHSIVEHYRWSNAMVKFVKPEIQQINRFEKQRLARYQQEEAFFTEHSEIIKHDSARLGLDPVAIEVLPASPKRVGLDLKVKVARAKWWFVVDYTVPGLTYHWRIIRDLAKEKPERLVLNEGNAISIEGGW